MNDQTDAPMGETIGSPKEIDPALAALNEGMSIPPRNPGVPGSESAHAELHSDVGGEAPTPERIQQLVDDWGTSEAPSQEEERPAEDKDSDISLNEFVRAVFTEITQGVKSDAGFVRQLNAQLWNGLRCPIPPAEVVIERGRTRAGLEELNDVLDCISKQQEIVEDGERALFRAEALVVVAKSLASEYADELKTIGQAASVLVDAIERWVNLRMEGILFGHEYMEVADKAQREAEDLEDQSKAAKSGQSEESPEAGSE